MPKGRIITSADPRSMVRRLEAKGYLVYCTRYTVYFNPSSNRKIIRSYRRDGSIADYSLVDLNSKKTLITDTSIDVIVDRIEADNV